jgi:hypothetical protein
VNENRRSVGERDQCKKNETERSCDTHTSSPTHRRSMSRATESDLSFFFSFIKMLQRKRIFFCTLHFIRSREEKNQVTFADMCMHNEFVLMQRKMRGFIEEEFPSNSH